MLELLMYPVRIFLCTYVILGHPEVVCSGKGNHEIAVRLIPEFESSICIIVDGPSCSSLSRPSSPNATSNDWGFDEPRALSQQCTMEIHRSQ
jgi:hypothetical protein